MAEVQPGPSSGQTDVLQLAEYKPISTDKSIQVSMVHKFRSKSTQTLAPFNYVYEF